MEFLNNKSKKTIISELQKINPNLNKNDDIVKHLLKFINDKIADAYNEYLSNTITISINGKNKDHVVMVIEKILRTTFINFMLVELDKTNGILRYVEIDYYNEMTNKQKSNIIGDG